MKPRKYDVQLSSTFKKSRKKLKHQPKKIQALNEVIEMLACDEVLDEKYHDHKLIGTYVDCRECHIEPDLLLIDQKKEEILLLHCVDVGPHNELFSRKKSIKKT